MLNWVVEEGYAGDEPFQKYHARKFAEQSRQRCVCTESCGTNAARANILKFT
jgi:hypothetical protein|tara:strand:- start:10843 stop:10998 length:156 start_codon:yes stop_codon:yes gene_type:complete